MNGVDSILSVFLFFGAYHGFKKGFMTELFSLLLVILSCIKGFGVYNQYLPFLIKKFPTYSNLWPSLLFIAICFIAGCLIIGLTKLFKNILNITFLGIFDSILGAIWGTLKFAVLIGILPYGWQKLPLPSLLSFHVFRESSLLVCFQHLLALLLSLSDMLG